MTAAQLAVVVITVLLNAMDGFDILSIAFASPGIAKEWGIAQLGLGIVLSMELIGMAIGSVLLGGVADKIGRRPTLLGCLVVMASDVSQGRLRRLPWDYRERYGLDPFAVPVVDAVRASMSIPFFYEPVKLKDRLVGQTCWLVDGGMLSNFPVDVFDRADGAPPRWPTFGIKLSTRAGALQGVPNDVHGAYSLARAMLATMTSFHDQQHLDDPAVVARTIFVDTLNVRATDFDIDRTTQQQLYDSGRRAATKFLDGGDGRPAWDFADYVARHRTAGAATVHAPV